MGVETLKSLRGKWAKNLIKIMALSMMISSSLRKGRAIVDEMREEIDMIRPRGTVTKPRRGIRMRLGMMPIKEKRLKYKATRGSVPNVADTVAKMDPLNHLNTFISH